MEKVSFWKCFTKRFNLAFLKVIDMHDSLCANKWSIICHLRKATSIFFFCRASQNGLEPILFLRVSNKSKKKTTKKRPSRAGFDLPIVWIWVLTSTSALTHWGKSHKFGYVLEENSLFVLKVKKSSLAHYLRLKKRVNEGASTF